jgi:glucose/arabinose dehydrogenase
MIMVLLAGILAACSTTQAATPPPEIPQIILTATSAPAAAQPALTPTPPQTTTEPTQPAALAGVDRPAQAPAYQWVPLATGLNQPTDLQEAPDGSGRMMVLEQAGVIRVVDKTGALQAEPYLDIRDRVGTNGSERGLLGLAFHPKFQQNGFFYVNYTDKNGDTHIARFTASSGAAGVDPGTEKLILFVKQPFPNHNGGGLVFGPDQYLYIGLGDGGSGGDPRNNGQSLNTHLGKILRIDVNSGDPYGIPPNNPFAKGGGLPEIWAYGLRNPWRFSFDTANGDLYIADVGQNAWEEIDYIAKGSPAGLNFGWRFREGANPFAGNPPAGLNLVDPVWQYSHSEGCSVTGGGVYRGSQIPELQGTYLFGDYCSGTIWGLKRDAAGTWQAQRLFDSGASISSFSRDLSGEFYLLDQKGGQVLKLTN